ncbi:hypothetical protein N7537_004614 [Penicillium hordei]|uniref:Leucine-rich repeat domain-containing protein n=1 Tax=Penicillium hordei TaxID=40994 RepID=A0AAD6H698_9EURO|nr:uncharacterized protein N7537_004614 [Penicillium hordei]KAJ5607995.1 hypothetical protein N7537_004614 [Penicillium hordei]
MSLNNDIFLLISEHLDDQSDQLNLLVVCHDWYSIFFPKAYKTISVDALKIYPLSRAVRNNPRIGTAIQNLSVDWYYSKSEPGNDYDVDGLVETLKQAGDAADDLAAWEESLRTGCPDAWLAVLVLSLKSIKSMTLRFSRSPHFLPMVTRIAANGNLSSPKPVLQLLESVDIWVDDPKEYYLAHEILPFFYLPAMRVFTAGGVCEVDPGIASLKPGTSTIRKIDLGRFNTNNGANGFAEYIISCANLEIFDYQHDNKSIWGEVYTDFYPLLFYNALCSQKHSLRELRLNNNGETGESGFDEDTEGFNGFGSLAEFHQLRELRMPLRTVLQFGSSDRPKVSLLEVLPPSLEFLNLAHYHEEDFEIVSKNLETMLAQRERLPNLKRIEIQPYTLVMTAGAILHSTNFRVQESTQQSFLPFEMACHEMGIQFGFSKEGNCGLITV